MAQPSYSIFGFQFPEPDVSNFSDKGILLEIGTFLGRSAVVWAEAFEKAGKDWRVVTVDDYSSGEVTGKEQEKKVKENLKGWNNITTRKATFNREFTIDIIPTAVFYDGNHEYEYVQCCLNMYKHLDNLVLKYPVGLNDLGKNFLGNNRAVDNHAKKYNKNLKITNQVAYLTKRETDYGTA
jgi:cephalosporin hydroxylase